MPVGSLWSYGTRSLRSGKTGNVELFWFLAERFPDEFQLLRQAKLTMVVEIGNFS